ALAGGTALADIAGAVQFTTPGGNVMSSILLAPIPITQANLNVVLDANWITVDALCQGVAAGTVEACP
ncbi:MAG: D-xylose ABC transporter substrate-binding protein, partial [Acidimicrobiia bacterium]